MKNSKIYTLTLVLAAAMVFSGMTGYAWAKSGPEVLYHWVQLAPEGDTKVSVKAVVKAIVKNQPTLPEASCPTLHVDGKQVAMKPTTRTKPAVRFDEIKLCEAEFGSDSPHTKKFTKAFFDEKGKEPAGIIPYLRWGVPLSSMVSYGCSGCRHSGAQSECDTKDWPLQQINDDAAMGTPSKLPPLLVHLGDYRYADQSKLDDSWADLDGGYGWDYEVFTPMKKMLEEGFFIPIRGNHEACIVDGKSPWMKKKKIKKDRGAAWFYFFDFKDRDCESANKDGDMVDAYALDASVYTGTFDKPAKTGGAKYRLVFMDTARTGDSRDKDPADSVERYTGQFDRVNKHFIPGKGKDRPVWYFSHIPVYSLNKSDTEFQAHVLADAVDASKLKKNWSRVAMAQAAHRHEFELVNARMGNPAKRGPIQYVVGNGGVVLSGKTTLETACLKSKVSWTPFSGGDDNNEDGDDDEKSSKWIVLRRPNFGYLRSNFEADGKSRLAMRFFSAGLQQTWYGDATVNCKSSDEDPSRIGCYWLPEAEKTPDCP